MKVKNQLADSKDYCIVRCKTEDKICKDIFKKNSEVNKVFKGLPNIPYEYMPKLKVISKNIPTDMELEENNRSRSATLRIAEKIKKSD